MSVSLVSVFPPLPLPFPRFSFLPSSPLSLLRCVYMFVWCAWGAYVWVLYGVCVPVLIDTLPEEYCRVSSTSLCPISLRQGVSPNPKIVPLVRQASQRVLGTYLSPPVCAGVTGVGSHMCVWDLHSSLLAYTANIISHRAISTARPYVLLMSFSQK